MKTTMKNATVKKLIAAAAIGAAAATLLAGCGGSSTASGPAQKEPAAGYASSYNGAYAMPAKNGVYNNPQSRDNIKDGGTLTLSTNYVPNWNNVSTDGNSTYMSNLWRWYMPNLLNFTEDGEVSFNKDYLTSVEQKSSNPLVVVYNINPKAKWNDGTEIDWTAFKAMWETQNGSNPAYNPPSTEGWDQIKSITEGTNAKQAVVTFKQPWYPWQSLFTTLVNPKLMNPTTFTSGWIDNPHSDMAAGPFIVQSADQNQVTFVRNPKWWGDKAKLEKVQYKYMATSATVNAFQNGEIDAIDGFSSAQTLKSAKQVKNAQIRLGYSTSTNVIIYNSKAGFLKDLLVRKALTQGLNRATYRKIAYQGTGWKASAPGSELFPVFQEGYANNMPKDAAYNPAAAKKNLEKAGFKMGSDGYYHKDGKVLTVAYTYFGDSPTGAALARAYQAEEKAIGVKVTLNNVDNAKWNDTIMSGNYEVLPMGWNATSPFGQVNVSQLYGSNSDSNFSFVGSKEVDQLAKVPGTISDQLKAVEAANKAEKAALELYGQFPTSVPPNFVAVKKGLANFGPAGFLTVPAENVGWQK